MGPSRPGQLDDLRTSARARVAKTSGRPRGTSDTSASHPGVLWTPRALGPKGVCHGELVDTTGLQTRARDARNNWWTPLALGLGT